MKKKKLSVCLQQALDSLREHVGEACGVASEREVLQAFADEVGAEIAGWEMRLQEIGDSDEGD